MSYISYYNPDTQFTTSERCDINELLNYLGDSDCSIARARVAPGVTTQLHAVKNTIERYVILEGNGRVFIDNSPAADVGYLDIISIPADAPQKIHNCGNIDLIFLCICTPRFVQTNYQNLEPERKTYQPVSCAVHSELELAVMHSNQLEIHYAHLNETIILRIKPYDLITRKDKGEFLLATDDSGNALEIRLDSICKFKLL